MFNRYFSRFLNSAVMFVLFFALIMSIIYVGYFFYISNNKIFCVLTLVFYFFIFIIYRKYKNKIAEVLDFNNEKVIVFIIIAALIIRVFWVINIPTNPTSDFGLMYKSAADVAKGQFYMFKDNSYFARFAHDTITVLYFSLFYHLTNNPLPLIKLLNIIYETASVFLLYLVIKEAIGKKSAIIGSIIMTVFPAYIMYTSEAMSENIALPFYLLSVYLFLKAFKNNNRNTFLFLCGLSLSIGNMFRMVGEVFLIAFIMYLLIYKGFKEGLKSSIKIIISFTLLLVLVSQTLISTGITEVQLWNSKEPAITSILKGTNIAHYGRWNKEDASIPYKFNYDPKAIKEASKKIIIQRLTETPIYKVAFHYVVKLATQWGLGDFGAYGWSVEDADNTNAASFMKYAKSEINILSNLIYISLLIRILIAMYKREYEDFEKMNFFFILFGGFVLLYLITETQERYGFIAAWLLVIFAVRNRNVCNIPARKHITI
ncbi:glycosyltransferase family 39 protein [Candidatus Clostridium stratigraminis]|uniref:Glycosyltransferase family 39 protein n=1 Tax=Candidatus Clostridium stratigraminis TaxID=3381661 RepID=A0ABW8T1Y0_9CLOT